MAGLKRGELNVATVSNRELPTRKTNFYAPILLLKGVDRSTEHALQ